MAIARLLGAAVLTGSLVLAAASFGGVRLVTGDGLRSGDAHDYAQIARRIATGRGFTTGALYPVELSRGVSSESPSLYRAPLWPLVLAGGFALAGPDTRVVHAALLVVFLALVACGVALASARAGPVAGGVAGVALATAPPLLLVGSDGLAESLVALWVTLVFLLAAWGAAPFWVGVVCGLAYLTHYAAAVVLPAALVMQWLDVRARRGEGAGRAPPLAWLALGFAAAASPWWIRNALVAGDPFYTVSSWVPYLPWEMTGGHRTPLHQLDPTGEGSLAVSPLEKLRHLLPVMAARWPLASMGAVAAVGVGLGCVRRDRPCLGFAVYAVLATGMAALSLVFGRYLVPALPAMLALGAAAWWAYGGRLRVPALVLLLVWPWLPVRWPALPHDLALMRAGFAHRLETRGEPPPDAPDRAACIAPDTLVLAEDAPRVVWETDAVAIRLPATRADLDALVARHPVRFAVVPRSRWTQRVGLARHFERRPACGPDVWARRSSESRAGASGGSGRESNPPGTRRRAPHRI